MNAKDLSCRLEFEGVNMVQVMYHQGYFNKAITLKAPKKLGCWILIKRDPGVTKESHKIHVFFCCCENRRPVATRTILHKTLD